MHGKPLREMHNIITKKIEWHCLVAADARLSSELLRAQPKIKFHWLALHGWFVMMQDASDESQSFCWGGRFEVGRLAGKITGQQGKPAVTGRGGGQGQGGWAAISQRVVPPVCNVKRIKSSG